MNKPTQTERLLELLKDRDWHSMRALNEICFRYGARFKELRDAGYTIETRQISAGLFWYRLVAEPGEQRQMALV